MAREDHQFKVRLDSELKARIETSARQAGRSMNSEIVLRLEISCRMHPNLDNGQSDAAQEARSNERYHIANGIRLVGLAMTEIMEGKGGIFTVTWRSDDLEDQDAAVSTITYKIPAG